MLFPIPSIPIACIRPEQYFPNIGACSINEAQANTRGGAYDPRNMYTITVRMDNDLFIMIGGREVFSLPMGDLGKSISNTLSWGLSAGLIPFLERTFSIIFMHLSP